GGPCLPGWDTTCPGERTHVLAKQVTADDRLGEWQSAPACIEHLVTEDCNPAVP
uniref:Uncharacterized protein n=1 Tax=Oryza glaberrima TaxID=4538 RepID=I1QHE3_ORYGL